MTAYRPRDLTPRLLQAMRTLKQGRHEVDLVIDVGRRNVAIEVKAATRWSQGDLSGLRAFLDRTPTCVAAVLAHNGRESVKLGDRLFAIPMGALIE